MASPTSELEASEPPHRIPDTMESSNPSVAGLQLFQSEIRQIVDRGGRSALSDGLDRVREDPRREVGMCREGLTWVFGVYRRNHGPRVCR